MELFRARFGRATSAALSVAGGGVRALFAIGILLLVPGVTDGSPGGSSAPLKIGVGRVFPISYRGSDGKFAGFGIDVLREAARREKIAVEWMGVNGSKESEDDLRSGRIDLMPAGMVTPERQRMFYVSEPWWSSETTLVSRADHPQLNRLGINPIFRDQVGEAFPGVELVPYPWAELAVQAACEGEVDAAFIAHGELHDIVLNRPEACSGVRLSSGDTTVSIELAIISRKSDAAVASRLRSRIDEMAADGTLMRMAVKNPPIPTASVAQFERRLHDRFSRRLWMMAGGMFAAFVAWFLISRHRNLVRAKRAESELRNLHNRLSLKHEVARIGTFEWSLPDGCVTWSREMENLYGIQSETHQHTFEEWETFVHPDDLAPTLAAMEATTKQRKAALDTTYRIIRPDGKAAWILSRGKYGYDANGRPIHMLGVNMDITDLKRTEESLRQTEQELRHTNETMALALDAGNSGGWVWNVETGELSWTESYFRLLGVDPKVKPSAELFDSLVHPDDLEDLRKSREDAAQGRIKEFRTEFRIQRADGVRWLERRGRVVSNSDGRPVHVIGINTDITERKILRGLLPACAQCKKIRDEHDKWQDLEKYLSEHSDARLSHGLCPDCLDEWAKTSGVEMNETSSMA